MASGFCLKFGAWHILRPDPPPSPILRVLVSITRPFDVFFRVHGIGKIRESMTFGVTESWATRSKVCSSLEVCEAEMATYQGSPRRDSPRDFDAKNISEPPAKRGILKWKNHAGVFFS